MCRYYYVDLMILFREMAAWQCLLFSYNCLVQSDKLCGKLYPLVIILFIGFYVEIMIRKSKAG